MIRALTSTQESSNSKLPDHDSRSLNGIPLKLWVDCFKWLRRCLFGGEVMLCGCVAPANFGRRASHSFGST